jgi:hypothetical protein
MACQSLTYGKVVISRPRFLDFSLDKSLQYQIKYGISRTLPGTFWGSGTKPVEILFCAEFGGNLFVQQERLVSLRLVWPRRMVHVDVMFVSIRKSEI